MLSAERFLRLFRKPDVDTLDKYLCATEASPGDGRTPPAQETVNLKAFLLDYKAKLYTPAALAEYYDDRADKDLGFKPENTDVTSGDLNLAGYASIFRQMGKKFGFKYVISSLRVSKSASDNGWSACIYSSADDEFYHSREYRIRPIVDRVGGGDSFAGGTICGFVDGKNFKEALEFGVAASALKHTIPGDFNLVTREEVETLAGGDGSGRVQR